MRIMKHLASLVGFLIALPFIPVSASVANANPSAGTCAETVAGLVCNVQGETLSFTTVGGLTQSGATTTRHFDPSAGQSITYESVFTDGNYIVDAVLRVDSKTGTPVIDDDNISDDRGVAVRARSGTNTEFTISFQERVSETAVTMLNVSIVVQDIDGTQNNGTVQTPNLSNAREYAIFQGLNTYTTPTISDLKVATNASQPAYDGNGTAPGNESTNPETGVRQFYSEESSDASVDEKNSVAIAFNSTTSVGIRAGTWESGGGINFLFGPPTFSLPTTTHTVNSGTYTVQYDVQGGTGTQPTDQTASGAISLRTGTGLVKASIPISGWSTLPSGAGAKYALGATFTPVKNITLYAVYESATVTFAANTGTGSNYTQISSGPTSLSGNSFTKDGFRFINWATNQDGTGATYIDEAQFPFLVSDTLYAQWAEEFTLAFDANGGTGSMTNQVEISSTSITANAFTRAGYVFTGWNTSDDGSGTPYADRAAFPFNANDTLFAQWEAEPVVAPREETSDSVAPSQDSAETPETKRQSTPSSLPSTGSDLSFLWFSGFLILCGYGTIRHSKRRTA